MTYALYNDNDPGVAAWLRNLIRDGLLPEGDVDERSIKEVTGADLKGYTQVHFFCGIGGWPLALERAGWNPARPVWTGSCPCQPFSTAGRLGDTDDPRHLWPEFFRLIAECRPSTVFGEQVASKLGRGWLAGVRADLEGVGYAVGASDICAAGAGAPHIRQRLWWVADGRLAHSTDADRRAGVSRAEAGTGADAERRRRLASGGPVSGLADAEDDGRGQGHQDARGGSAGSGAPPERLRPTDGSDGADGGLADAQRAELQRRGEHRDVGGQAPAQRQRPGHADSDSGADGRLADPGRDEFRGRDGLGDATGERLGEEGEHLGQPEPRPAGAAVGLGDADEQGREGRRPGVRGRPLDRGGREQAPPAGSWDDAILIPCRDNKVRRVESGTFPLAHGLPGKLGPGSTREERVRLVAARANRKTRLGGYGNAINPAVASIFVTAYLETEEEA